MGKLERRQSAWKILHRSSRFVASVSTTRGHNGAWKLQGEHLSRCEDCGKVTAKRPPRVPRTHENHFNNQPDVRAYLGCVVRQYAQSTFSITLCNCLPAHATVCGPFPLAKSRQSSWIICESSILDANSWAERTMDSKRAGQRRRPVRSDAASVHHRVPYTRTTTVDSKQSRILHFTDRFTDCIPDWTNGTNNECRSAVHTGCLFWQ